MEENSFLQNSTGCAVGYIVLTKVQISIRTYDITMKIKITERFCVETFCLKCILAAQKRDLKKGFFVDFRRAQGILQIQLFLN